MADTVKKSRIVSEDDNLEESLVKEFNMRLKNCMSQDNLQNSEEDGTNIYENIEAKSKESVIKSAVSSRDFIQIESEHFYEEPVLKNGTTTNGHNILAHQNNDKTDLQMDQYVEMHSNSEENQEHLGNSPQIHIDQEYEEVNVKIDEPNYEELDEVKSTPNFTLQTDLCPESSSPVTSSVKDRMFLATDDASCLLFTQTVTSPMLTPSEENIDFLKGFRRETPPSSTETSNSNGSPKSENLAEEISTTSKIEDESILITDIDNDDSKEVIYENLNVKEEEPIYENLKDIISKEDVETNIPESLKTEFSNINNNEAIYENIEEIKQSLKTKDNSIITTTNEFLQHEIEENEKLLEKAEIVSEIIPEEVVQSEIPIKSPDERNREEKYTEFIVHNKCETNSNYYEKYTEVLTKNNRNVEINREKDTETVPAEIVKNLKTQFSKTNTAEIVGITKKELNSTELKTINIMKHINKFEHKEFGDVLLEDDDSTEITESYVETTTSEIRTNGEKSLKKKKSKKSRKEEKENISVSESDSIEENFYNVNVKNLCRSFGDLTKIGDEIDHCRSNERKVRTKSLSDVTLSASNNKCIENVFSGVSVRNLKSSFSKFDALQKKNVLHVRSSDSSKAQEKFNGNSMDTKNCKACAKAVFQMEQIKAEKAVWHKNCFRCTECNKQLTVDTYESHEGSLYCKPHFKALFAPKAVEEEAPQKPRKPELIIRENQPLELPPDVVRASDKPDLGLEELQSLNVKERFQVFEHHQTDVQESDKGPTPLNVKRSPSILSKLARFQAKGMDVGVADESLNGIPIEESSSDEEVEDEIDGEDADLVRAKRVQKEKPFHFTGMSDVKNKWEFGEQNSRDERREERKQEIQSIRNRLFMGKQGKMKEAYQQAVMESESCTNLRKSEKIESCDTKSLKERFEKGELGNEKDDDRDKNEDDEVFESEISKKSRSLFLELDANASKAPHVSQVTPSKQLDVRKAREAFLAKSASQDVVKSSEFVDDVTVKTADIQQRFKFFETYKEPEKTRKQFRITPPREGQVKTDSPEREIYRDPDVVRGEEFLEDDSEIAKETHTATKMLNKFRQLEENLNKDNVPAGPKPLKRFTPPPEQARTDSNSEDESGSEEESYEDDEQEDEIDNTKIPEDLLEAQKAARARQLRAKFEKWEANEIKREQNNSSINIAEEFGEEQSQIESTKSLRARFESMRETSSDKTRTPRVKVNRFVEMPSITDTCQSCNGRVYPLEKISVHGLIYHKKCFKCMECSCVLRMDSYSYNQGLLYCTPHFKRLFISKGNYDTAFGLGQHKEKWNSNATIA